MGCHIISSPGLFTCSDIPYVFSDVVSGKNMITFLKNIIEKCVGNMNGIYSGHTDKSIRRGSADTMVMNNTCGIFL